MLDDDTAFEFVKVATAQEDRAFQALLSMVSPIPVGGSDPAAFDPRFSANESATYFLVQQEHKMKDFGDWPQAVKDHELDRTEKMRKALQDKLGAHFDAWYDKVKREHSHLA